MFVSTNYLSAEHSAEISMSVTITIDNQKGERVKRKKCVDCDSKPNFGETHFQTCFGGEEDQRERGV